jgi:F-type H+-transporting ATPase subunit b
MRHWNRSVVPATAVAAAVLALPPRLLAQGGAEGGGAALFNVNVGLTIWTIVIFLLLVLILGKFAWGPILSSAKAREDRIQQALDEAAQRQAEAVALLEQHRAQLADARRQAQEIVNEGKTAGERVRRDIEEKARTEGQSLLERAKSEIEREKESALDQIRKESVDLALAAAARLMNEKLDPEKDRRLVVSYLDEVAKRDGGLGGRA